MLREAAAFLKKDLLTESSYKLSFVFNFFGILVSVLSYFYIDKLFGSRMVPHLEEFGVNYFSYVLLSMAFFGYIGVGLGSFSERIRAEQTQGTLEAVLLTPTKIRTMLISLAMWNLVIATVDMLIYAVLAIRVFKVNFSNINAASAVIVFILTVLSFGALGIISASFIMVFKRGNPLGWIMASLEGLIGGVYFPVTVLPARLQIAAKFFPITYAVRAIELAVYRGYSPAQLLGEIVFLSAFSAILLPASLAFFKFSLRKARRDGSLSQY